jgi:hypothetical protein
VRDGSALHGSGVPHAAGAQRKKNAKKRRDAVVTELTLGTPTAAHRNVKLAVSILLWLIALIGVLACMACMGIYLVESRRYKLDIGTLHDVGDLSCAAALLAEIALQCYIHDVVFNFSWAPSPDGEADVLMGLPRAQTMLLREARHLANIVSSIHSFTSLLEPWESSSIPTYFFSYALSDTFVNPDGSPAPARPTHLVKHSMPFLSSSHSCQISVLPSLFLSRAYLLFL